MKGLAAAALALALLPMGWAQAQTVVGLSVPKSGRFARLGQELEFGVQMAIEDAVKRGAARPSLRIIDDACADASVMADVEALRQANARIVVGAPCFAPAYALVRGLNRPGSPPVPVVAVGIRHVDAEKPIEEGLPFFILGPDGDAEAEAVASLVLTRWRDTPYALLDDGSVQARALTDRLRAAGDLRGLRPLQNVTFRPLQSNQTALLRRMASAGVEAIFVAGEPEDIAVMAADARRLGLTLEIAAGESAELAPLVPDIAPLPEGTLAVFRDRAVDQPTAQLLLELLRARGVPPSDPLVTGYALGQIALQGAAVDAANLKGTSFDTVLGPIVFGADQRAEVLPFRLRRWTGERFEVIAR